MTELVEAVNPAFPAKGEKHDEIEIKILEIKDADGTSIMDGAADYDVRQFGANGDKKSTIKFDVKRYESIVVVEIEADPGNAVGKKYYGRPAAKTFVEPSKPGEHTVKWDGRSDILGERLLVEGEYKVTAIATCPCGNQYIDVKKIKVKKPYADAYGAKYPEGDNYGHGADADLTPPAAHVRSTLPSLKDGSGFECGGSATATAKEALNRMRYFSAVWYWDGHSSAGIIDFYNAAGTNHSINSSNSVGAAFRMAPAVLAPVDDLPAKALDDVFLVVLLGCNTSQTPEGGASSLPAALVDKGVDIVVSFEEKVWLRAYLKWTKDFFKALNDGKGVRPAADWALSEADPDDQLVLEADFATGGGASGSDKLLPARYGRRKA